MASWVSRHPDDGRYILTNGYDWTYFTVEDVPFFVKTVRRNGSELVLTLNDGSEETVHTEDLELLPDGAVRTHVKGAAPFGPYDAKFDRAALVDLAEVTDLGDDGALRLIA